MKRLFQTIKATGTAVVVVAAFASCTTLSKTARTTETSAKAQSATIADLRVGERVTETMNVSAEIRRGGMRNIRQAVEHQALEKAGNADLLLNPEYVIRKERGLFSSKVTQITVSGRPAYFTNFHAVNDSMWCNPVFRGVAGKRSYARAIAAQEKVATTETDKGNGRRNGWAGYITLQGGGSNVGYDGSETTLAALASVGYQFNPRWFLGVGTGIMGRPDDDLEGGCFIPIYCHGRYNFRDKKVTPFLDLKIGGMFDADEPNGVDSRGGFYASPSFGYSFGRFDIAISYAFYRDDIEFKYDDWWKDFDDETENWNIYTLSIGFRF